MAAPNTADSIKEDELKGKSEEIDLFHLEFDWNEFRKHGMRFPFGINRSTAYNKNKSSKDNNNSPSPSPEASSYSYSNEPNGHNQHHQHHEHNGRTNNYKKNGKYRNKLKANKMFQHLSENWQKLVAQINNNTNNMNNNNNNNPDSNSNVDINCDLDSSHCPCVNRLIFILTTYHNWCDIQQNINDDNNNNNNNNNDTLINVSMCDIIDNLPFYSQILLYNDYCHMLDFHSSSEEFWEFIHIRFKQCKLQKCKLFMRNHRSRENFIEINKRKSLFFGYEGSDHVINIQFLDRVHSYLLHSNINITEENNLYNHVIKNNEKQIEQKLRKFQDFRTKRQKELEKCQINLANNTKFVTEIEEEKKNKDINNNDIESQENDNNNNNNNDDDDDDDDEEKKNDNNNNMISVPILNLNKSLSSNLRNTELNEYSFGATFKYWDHFSHKKVYCIPKYSNLKQEMLKNRVFTVSEFQWNDTLYKAIQIKMSYKGQSLFAINRGGTNNHYSIPYKMPISLSHIMVVLFYCNFDSLQRKFKQQCRPTHKKESRQSLNERNSEIGHWFSLLKEVCWFYGQAMKPGDIFYHGINKTLLFTQFHARFRFPLSTTTSLKEASLFANFHTNDKKKKKKKDGNNDDDDDTESDDTESDEKEDDDDDDIESDEGIIIELGYCELCFYIDVQMMSDFPAENEKLFFGADLAIQNIYYQNKSYKKFVSALTLFQSIINGRFFVDILKENKVYQQILLNMINNFQYKYGGNLDTKNRNKQIIRNNKKYNNDIPEYIQDLFEYFYLNQHYVWIIKSQLKYLEPRLRKYFLPFIHDQQQQQETNDDESDNKTDGKPKKYILNLARDDDVDHEYIKSYPLKYCVEYIWKIVGNEFNRFKTMKNGEWINCEQEFIYNINQYEYDEMDQLNDNNNNNDDDDINNNNNNSTDREEETFAIFQCSCAPSKTGKHSFFMKVNTLSRNLERILFGVDLYCPSISFKTSVPRRWFKQSDYLGYTMFDSEKLKNLQHHFEWHIAIKIYDYKKINNTTTR